MGSLIGPLLIRL